MRSLAVLITALAACNQAFGLEGTTPAPAIDAVDAVLDTDSDGVADLDDNCRMVGNASQHDEDHDGVGDVCDNCPLVENNGQADLGEGAAPDGVGDACDPHPTDSHDCLVLFDSFATPSSFASHWQMYGTPALDPQPDFVHITPSSAPGGFVALDDSGSPLMGTFGVQLLAKAFFPVAGTGVSVISNGRVNEPTLSGLLCKQENTYDLVITLDGTGPVIRLSATPVGQQLLIRLSQPTKQGGDFTCRTDYGYAVAAGYTTATSYVPGLVGVIAAGAPNDMEAVALYELADTCPTPIFR